ncbi:MAG: hypothetical protein B6229_06210 [Spirochaetaceae bacterium 4572_7]|nr:MAG: hypothetical protein B6229_06210 [Spirochaetaceae bacterium 4572_7]
MFSRIIAWLKDGFFKSIIKNSLTLITGNVGASILGSVSLVISIKFLGLETFGVFTIVQTYVRIFDGLLNFQSWETIIRLGSEAQSKKDYKLLKSYIKQGFILDICSAILGTVVAFVSVGFIGSRMGWDADLIFLTRLMCLIIAFNIAGTPIGILRLFRKYKTFSFQKIISAVIKLVGVIIAYILKGDLFSFIIITMVADISGYLILIYMGYKTLKENSFRDIWSSPLLDKKEFLKFSLWSNINSTLSLPVREMDKIIVSLISFEAVGVYKLFKQIMSIIGKVVTPIYQTIYPELAKFISEKKYKKAVSISKRIGVIMLAVGIPLLLILASTSFIWLKWIIGFQSIHYCLVLSFFLFTKVFSNAFIGVNPLFVSAGYIKYNFFIIIIASILYLSLAYFLVLRIGLLGIVIASFAEIVWSYGVKIVILSRDNRFIRRRTCYKL